MTTNGKLFCYFASCACIVVCIADFFIMYALGLNFPGYSQIRDSISRLGASVSPVSLYMSAWWVFIGVIFILFGLALKRVYTENGKVAIIASWLIIIYGLGEGFGSGFFQANHIGNELSLSCKIHDTLGGIGIAAVLILPLVLRKIFTRKDKPFMFHFLLIMPLLAFIMLILFSLAKVTSIENNIFEDYYGLTQRLLTLVIYIYLVTIAIMTMRKVKEAK